jgi:hypothetical protein
MNIEQTKEQIDNNNIRLTEINSHYSEEYKAYIELLKVIVLFSLCILILSILKSFIIIPDIILNSLMGLILIGGIMYSLWLYYDISLRNKMNFSEYEWQFSKPKSLDVTFNKKEDSGMKSISDSLGLGCIGMECCSEGMTYDSDLNKCVSPLSNAIIDTPMIVKSANDESYPPCYGLTDESPSNIVKPDCLQKIWTDSGCNSNGTAYPPNNYKGWWNDGTGAKTLGAIKADMKAWGTLTDNNHVVGCKGKNSMISNWRCLNGITVPLRKNEIGDVECMSQNNKDCLWKGNDAECNTLLANPPANLKPLVCGDMHKLHWGGPGYENPAHWCAKGKQQL